MLCIGVFFQGFLKSGGATAPLKSVIFFGFSSDLRIGMLSICDVFEKLLEVS